MEFKNMKQKLLALLAGTVLASTPAMADNCCYDPCCPDTDWCGGWFVGAEFLYWKACQDDLGYAVTYNYGITESATEQTVVTKKYLDHDWTPAFRITAGKKGAFCGSDLIIQYTRWEDTASGKTTPASGEYVVSPWLFESFENVANNTYVKAKHKLRYQTLDVLLAYDCEICCNNHLRPFFGFEWLNIDQKASSSVVITDTSGEGSAKFNWNSDFNAYGLKVGTEYSFTCCECFEFYALASGTLAVSDDFDTHTKHYYANSQESVSFNRKYKHNHDCAFVPGYHLGVGLRYETCYCDWDIVANIGYEFIEWRNLPTISNVILDSVLDNYGTNSTLGFHGLVAGLAVSF